jgi:uncharacterized SAM-binding protein YcdF (DUF218 family)
MRRVLLGLLVLVLAYFAVTTTLVARWMGKDERPSVDAIVVLGAAQYDGRPSPVFQGRLDHAALLFDRGFADRIVVLGAGQPGDEFTEAEAGEGYLVGKGLSSEVVGISPRGNTTYESLEAAAGVMAEQGWQSAFLVSDPWHNLRIRRMARDLGIEGYVSATWHSAAESQATRLQGYARETFAYIYYRVFGQ